MLPHSRSAVRRGAATAAPPAKTAHLHCAPAGARAPPRPRRAASARAAAGEGASQAAAPAHAAAQAPPAAPDATNGGANGGLLNNNHGHASAALNKGDYSKFVQFFRQASPYIVGHRRAAAAAAADRRIALWPRGWRWPTASQRRGEQPAC